MDNQRLLELYQLCINKTNTNIKKMGNNLREFSGREDGEYFKELEEGSDLKSSLTMNHLFVWTPSFYTGMACLAYEETKDENYLKWLNQFYNVYADKVFRTPMDTMHDLGFLYTPYAVALYKLTGDINMKKVGIKAAEELAKRYYPKGNYIRAWGRVDGKIPEYVDAELSKDHFFTESKGLAIVDCMMNLPLLYWASEATGSPYFSNIANAHADMTMDRFIREDNTVAHAFRFDEATGEPIGITNYCGYSDDSYWARGASWAIYGFVTVYSHTKDPKYLETSIRLANRYLEEVEEEVIPVWDFRLPESEEQRLDTSAASVCACAFIELAKYDKDPKWLKWADKIIEELATDRCLNTDIELPGIIKASNGRSVYWICGDYYFMEAISKRLGKTIGYW